MAIQTLAPQSGTAFELNQGDMLRVIDREGEQVADLTAFNRTDINEWLSSGRTIDYANTIYLTTNHVLYSNRSRPMFTITEDEVGRHDFLLTPCSPETFQIIYKTSATTRVASKTSRPISVVTGLRPTAFRPHSILS